RVSLGQVLEDRLADAAGPQQPDEKRGPDHRHHERDRPGHEDGDQAGIPPAASISSRATTRSSKGTTSRPICWVVSWPFPATTTTSPGRAQATASPIAARRS